MPKVTAHFTPQAKSSMRKPCPDMNHHPEAPSPRMKAERALRNFAGEVGVHGDDAAGAALSNTAGVVKNAGAVRALG
jgi:hypothetical protein